MLKNSLVIVPTYNESGYIGKLLPKLFELNLDLLIVDDGSSDGTIDIAKSIDTKGNQLNFLLRTTKLGLGSAYRSGYAWALEHGYERIIQMDADGSHQIVDLITLIDNAILHPNFLILGSRWIPGGEITNWPKWRQLISRTGTWYAKKMLKLKISDLTGGFKIYPVSFLEKIELDNIVSNGYSFQIEMTMVSILNGAKFVEIPINFVERSMGRSKMSFKIFIEAIVQVTRWGLALRMRHNADKLHYVT